MLFVGTGAADYTSMELSMAAKARKTKKKATAKRKTAKRKTSRKR
jgi:hypothetical protein